MNFLRTLSLLVVAGVIGGCARREPAPQTVSSETPKAVQPAAPPAPESAAEPKEDMQDDRLDSESDEAVPTQPAAPSRTRAKPATQAAPAAGAVESVKPAAKRRAASDIAPNLREANDELERSWASFAQTLDSSQSDCAEAGEHQRAICDIAARICSLVDQGAFRADTGGDPRQVCDSARAKCSSARDHLQNRCP